MKIVFLQIAFTIFYCGGLFAQDTILNFKQTENKKCALFLNKTIQITQGIYECGRGTCFNGLCRANKDGKYGFIDYTGNVVIPFEYSNAYYLSEGLIAVVKNDLWGYITKKGELAIPYTYISVSNFSQGLAEVSIKIGNDYKYGYINKKGEFVIPPKYDWSKSFSEGLAAVQINDVWGFIDKEGKPLTEMKYCNVQDFENGLARVSIGCRIEVSGNCALGRSTSGFIDRTGKEIIPVIFDQARIWEKAAMIEVRRGRASGAYTYDGNVIIPLDKYYSINRLDEENGLIEVTADHDELGYVSGFVNKQGKEIIPCLYRFKSHFINGFIYGSKDANSIEMEILKKTKKTFSNRREGVLDSLGNTIIPFEYEEISVFKNGFFRVKDYTNEGNRVFAFFDRNGKMILPFKYAYASYFSENGYAVVKDTYNSSFYFIDTSGAKISAPVYDDINENIGNNLVAIKKGDKWGYVNVKSEVIIPCIYEKAALFNNERARVSLHGKYGYINTKGNIIIPIQFDEAPYYFLDDIQKLKRDGNNYYFDKNGKEITDKAMIPED
ncbi:WG repeat-containing protein [Aquimarina aquimarini]|uniref:WG repeat-containing protein n=1 Tax=Aquimarina aquimarini TaxID=1191734 RepID=UPI001F1F9E3B|nr:WG repeat-containing protein [Aquimarina aquimarini]